MHFFLWANLNSSWFVYLSWVVESLECWMNSFVTSSTEVSRAKTRFHAFPISETWRHTDFCETSLTSRGNVYRFLKISDSWTFFQQKYFFLFKPKITFFSYMYPKSYGYLGSWEIQNVSGKVIDDRCRSLELFWVLRSWGKF